MTPAAPEWHESDAQDRAFVFALLVANIEPTLRSAERLVNIPAIGGPDLARAKVSMCRTRIAAALALGWRDDALLARLDEVEAKCGPRVVKLAEEG